MSFCALSQRKKVSESIVVASLPPFGVLRCTRLARTRFILGDNLPRKHRDFIADVAPKQLLELSEDIIQWKDVENDGITVSLCTFPAGETEKEWMPRPPFPAGLKSI